MRSGLWGGAGQPPNAWQGVRRAQGGWVDLAGSVPGLGKGASRPRISAHQTGTVQPPTAVPCRRVHWGAGSTRGPPGARAGLGSPSASPRFQIQPGPKLRRYRSRAGGAPPRGAPLRLRPSPRATLSFSRELRLHFQLAFLLLFLKRDFRFFYFLFSREKKKNLAGPRGKKKNSSSLFSRDM